MKVTKQAGELVQVAFHGDVLEAVERDGKVWVSLRRCCENLGLAMQSQLEKLKGKAWACVTEIVIHDASGRQQPSSVIDLDTLPGWLFSIDARKVKEQVREKLAHYQREAARVLADHFLRRQSPPPADGSTLLAAVAERLDRIERRQEELALQSHATAVTRIDPEPIPTTTIMTRSRFWGWTPTTKQVREVRDHGYHLCLLESGSLPVNIFRTGLWVGPQINALDEAIARVRAKYERADGEECLF